MKRFLSKALVFTSLLFLPVLASPVAAHAVNVFQPCTTNANATPSDVCGEVSTQNGKKGDNPLVDVVKLIINLVSVVVGIASVIMIVLGGFRLTIAGGDAQKAATARKSVIYAVVGIFITVVAQLVVVYVLDQVS